MNKNKEIEKKLLEASIILDGLKYQVVEGNEITLKDLETIQSCIDEALKLLREVEKS